MKTTVTSLLMSIVRRVLYVILPTKQHEGEMIDDNTHEVYYVGWYSVPLYGCVAFIRSDGALQFRW